jgi:hypothetical protein
MKYSVNLTDDQRKDLIEFYREKAQKLRNEVKDLEDLLIQLSNAAAPTSTVLPAEADSSRNRLASAEYKESWSWALKVRYVISKVGRCMPTRDVIDELKKYETFDKDPINSVSGTLSSKANKGLMFNKYKPYGAEYYFGLKEWFNNDGTIKTEYEAI